MLWQLDATWTLDDYRAAVRTTADLTANTSRYHILADLTRAQVAPARMLSALRQQHATVSKRYAGTLVFGANPTLSALLNAAIRLSTIRRHYVFVENVEEAYVLHLERLGLSASKRGPR